MAALSWSGTRGVISLAAIFTLPLTTDDGSPFPDRDLLLFCTFVVVLVTLVGQGLTFAPLVRRLGLRANESDQARVRNEARSAAVEAALARLDAITAAEPESMVAANAIRTQLLTRLARYRGRLDLLQQSGSAELPISRSIATALRVRRTTIDAQRDELVRWRDAGRLPDEELRVLERELDHGNCCSRSDHPADRGRANAEDKRFIGRRAVIARPSGFPRTWSQSRCGPMA